MTDAADVILLAPTERLAPGGAYAPNPRRRRGGFRIEDVYAGHAELLVRTALIRSEDYDERELPSITMPRDAAALCRHLVAADQEHLVVLVVDNSGRCRAIHETAIGSETGTGQSVPHLAKVALMTGATGIVLVHNHPSGRPAPSSEDKRMFAEVEHSFACVGLRLHDAIIVAREGWWSRESDGFGHWAD